MQDVLIFIMQDEYLQLLGKGDAIIYELQNYYIARQHIVSCHWLASGPGPVSGSGPGSGSGFGSDPGPGPGSGLVPGPGSGPVSGPVSGTGPGPGSGSSSGSGSGSYSLIVEDDVRQPYPLRGNVQNLHSSVLRWVPCEHVVVPLLRETMRGTIT